MQDTINALYEELIYLDEIAGELDPESNARIDQRRAEILQEIKDLRSLGTAYHDEPARNHNEAYFPDPDSEYENRYELDTDYL